MSPWRVDALPRPLTISGLIDKTVDGKSLGSVVTDLATAAACIECTTCGTVADAGMGTGEGATLWAGTTLAAAPSAGAVGGLTPFRF